MRLRLFICTPLLALALASCKPEPEEIVAVPQGLLTPDEIVPVLTESYLAESASGLNVLNVPGNKFDSVYVFDPLKDNNIQRAQLDSSLAFYSKHPKMLKSIFDKVLERMSRIQAAGDVRNLDAKVDTSAKK